MKSKDEILDKFYVPNMHWKFFNRKNVLSAMDKYSKNVAIDFANWAKQSKYCVNSMEEWFSYDSYEKPTTEQLFEQFKKENNIK